MKTTGLWRSLDRFAVPATVLAEWRMVLEICSCTNVTISGMTLAESGGDGIYLGTAGGDKPCKNVVIKDVICDRNYRQGISVINAENLLILHSGELAAQYLVNWHEHAQHSEP